MKKILDRYPLAFTLVLMSLCLMPIMALRDFTPANELRYLSIADEAIRDGNIFAFTNHGLAYADKPPLYFWIIMLSRLIFGRHSMFVLSLFSFIPAMVIIAVMDKWFRGAERDIYPRERAGAALMLGTSGLFMGMSVFLRMDMLMCMWIVLALYAFSKGRPSLFGVCTFLALFTKGPVGLLAPPLTVLVYLIVESRAKEIGKWLGWKFWGILLAGCSVWFLGVFLDGGKEYLNNLLFHQTVGRAVNSFHHKAPFWYYFAAIWEVMAPWCLATVSSVILSFCFRGRNRTESLWAWATAVTFIMLSCFSSKIAIYLAPVFPFTAYLFPMLVKRTGYRGWMKALFIIPCVLLTAIGLALAGVAAFWGPISSMLLEHGTDISAYGAAASPLVIIGGLILAAGGIAGTIGATKSWFASVIPSATSLLVAVFMVSWLIPSFNGYIGYRDLCREIPQDTEVFAWRVFRPDNVDVYLGHDISIIEKEAINCEEDVAKVVPADAVFVSQTKRFPDGIPGRKAISHGDYSVYLPMSD